MLCSSCGYLFANFVVGSAFGPHFYGPGFERLHSNEPAFWIFGLFIVLASILIVCLGPCLADIVRLENGKLAERRDVIQDEVKKDASRSGLPMFADKLPV